jgi:tetrahydromethanopterin S-methyltransferase subunit F
MASLSDTLETRRAAATETETHVNTRDTLKLEGRVSRLEIGFALVSVAGLLFGVTNFVLIVVLLGRL